MGFSLDPGPAPSMHLNHGQTLQVGSIKVKVLHTPGHTPGHVVFYCKELDAVMCGDLIFFHGIGRTDIDGGNFDQLITSIQNQIFTLPCKTRLLSGHGPETTIEEEMKASASLLNKTGGK